jgi:lipoyl(octanoyl) transferase
MAGSARLIDLGTRPYREVWALQRTLHERIAAGELEDTWLVVEHPPVVTLGRNTKRENVLVSPEGLVARGIDCVEIERGGDVTYHGPGQVVVYPLLRLPRFREVVPLVSALEDAAIAACEAFGVVAQRWSEHRGVYVGLNQICAVGLAVKRMTSMHGIAFNACTDLDYDRLITPCGIKERGVTSLARESRLPVSFDGAKAALVGALARRFDVAFVADAPPQALKVAA